MSERNTEKMPSHPHADMMRQIVGLPYIPYAQIREKKGGVITSLNFNNGDLFQDVQFLKVGGNSEEVSKLLDSIRSGLQHNDNIMVIGYDTSIWDSNIGAHPVAILTDPSDLDNRLDLKEDGCVGIRTQRGELLSMNEPLVIFARYRKSQLAEMSGFDNYDVPIDVRLGGGFRFQVDGVKSEDDTFKLVVTGSFCFNDMHPRMLALSSEEDKLIPRYKSTYELSYSNNLLIPDPSNVPVEVVIESKNIDGYSRLIVERIILQNQEAITKIFRLGFSVSPSFGTHQIEGFFGLTDGEIKTAIIDFDGIDNIDTIRHHLGEELLPDLKPQERLLARQLADKGFLLSDPATLLEYYRQKQRVEGIKTSILDSGIQSQITDSVINHLSHPTDTFIREQTGPVKLARLLKTLGLQFSETELPWLRLLVNGNNHISFLNIEGYEVAYWQRDGILMDTDNINQLTRELSIAIDQQIVQVHLNYLKEGD